MAVVSETMAPAKPVTGSPSALLKAGGALVLFLGYWALTIDPGYRPYLDDETRFLEAIQQNKLAFFPGYIGFLAVARALMNWISPGAALQAIAAFFGAATVAMLWLWLVEEGLAPWLAGLGVLAYAVSPYHWFNSSVGITYTVESFAFLGIGYCCWFSSRRPGLLFVAAVIFGLTGAFRQSTPIFLAPLFLWTCYRARAVRPVVLAAALSLIWFVPTLAHFGGAQSAVSAGAAQINDAVVPSTLASSSRQAAANLVRFAFYFLYGAHLLFLLALPVMRRFELLWLVPAALFYALVYVSWPGYVLGLLAGIYLLAIRGMRRWPQALAAATLAVLCVANTAMFLACRPSAIPSNSAEALVSTYGWQYSRWAIDHQYQVRLRDVLNRMHMRGNSSQ